MDRGEQFPFGVDERGGSGHKAIKKGRKAPKKYLREGT